MKSVTIAFLSLMTISLASAQHTEGTSAPLTVASTSPANLAANVATGSTSVSITFSDPLDTTSFTLGSKGPERGAFTSMDTVSAISFSSDHKTVTFTGRLSAGKSYFVLIYYAKSAASVLLAAPYGLYFTTAASFPSTTVSGTVYSGSSGVSTAGSFVALSSTSILGGDPVFIAGTVADPSGNFTIPYVPNGTLYPLAAKDVNGDGFLDPSQGDVVGTGSQVVVNNSSLSGVSITFMSSTPFSYKDVIDSLNAHSASFPTPNALKMVQANAFDSTGRSGYWEFDYVGTDRAHSFVFNVQSFGAGIRSMDSGSYSWVAHIKTIGSLPPVSAVTSFLSSAEKGGGGAYRPVPMSWNGFDVQLNIGDLTWANYWDMVPDTSKLYLGVTYWYGTSGQNGSTLKQRRFLGNYNTGAILGTTGITTPGREGKPAEFALAQNYPNPFNPSTNIEFTLPRTSPVRLSVYNMLGQEVATLVNGTLAAGRHTVQFDGTHLASGMYVYRIAAGNYVNTMKMVILK